MNNTEPKSLPMGAAYWKRAAEALADAARAEGFAVTIERIPTPGKPPAMWETVDRVEVMELRK